MANPLVEVNNISFRYDQRKEMETLKDVSFTVEKCEWLAIVGENGSGKSTLAQLLIGLLQTHKGSIYIDGIKMTDKSKWDIRRQLGVVFQNPDNQFIGTTVEDDIAFGLENMNLPYEEMKIRVNDALQIVGLTDLRKHDPSKLSGGQKQRVALAGILALKPKLLILDEAFVMLDPLSRRSLLDILQELKRTENITIISITHDMMEAASADRILQLNAGKVIRNCVPGEFFSKEDEMETPLAEQLRRSLIARGRDLPHSYMSEEELVKWFGNSIRKCKSRLSNRTNSE